MTDTSETILMSKDSSGRWTFTASLKSEPMLTIHHGVKSCKMKIKTIGQTHHTYILDQKMFEELNVPITLMEYRIKQVHPGEWILGPFVGIFTSENLLQKLLSQEDITVYDDYSKILERNQGLAVFFSLERILWDKGEVMGVVRDSSKSAHVWKEQVLPIPKVIYDRCYGPGSRKEGMKLRSQCASFNQGITVINALPRLGKMEIYQLCSQDDTLRQHLPQWAIFQPETAESLLSKFPVAYIKPNNLSKGVGVTKVTHNSNGFLAEQRRGSENYQHQCVDAGELLNVLSDYLNAPMVIQEAIPLRQYEGNPFDFRLLLQKNDTGQWQQTGIVARVFGKESVISSPRSGGRVATYDEAMQDLPKSERKRIATSLLNLALKIAQMLEKEFGLFAELGFDLGVDLNGDVWLIEVNGKPLKVSIERLNDKAMTAAAYERPLEYARYLAGFDRVSQFKGMAKIDIENDDTSKIIRSVEIRKTSTHANALKLAKNLLDIDLKSNNYLLKAGLRQTTAEVLVLPNDENVSTLFLTEEVLIALGLPDRTRLNLKCDGSNLILGPFVGVFISQNKVERLNCGNWDSVYWRLQNWGAENGGLVYFFTFSDIDWEQRKIKGYYWDKDKVWTPCTYPMPEVIYDRCFGTNSREISRTLREMIVNKGLSIRVFNQAVKIAKRETYEHLVKYPGIKKHIPPFMPYTPENLTQMIHQAKSIYIKPVDLYKGKGIVKVTKKNSNFVIEFQGEESNEKIVCPNWENLLKKLTQILLPDYEYVLQESIQLATFLGNRFDVRVMLQKKDSAWMVSALNARIAPVESIITSPRSGGKVFRLRDVLALSFPLKEDQILQDIKRLSESIGYKMEDKYGYLGELGIDLGIDVNGKVWVIEVNGRPLKVSFNYMKDKAISKVIHKNPILLGFSLSGFNIIPESKPLPSHLLGSLYAFRLAPQNWSSLIQNPSPRILFLNPQQIHGFKFKSGQRILLQVGCSSVEVEIKVQKMDLNPNAMFLSDKALADLPYYHGENISLISVSDRQLILQPTVGMTLSREPSAFYDESYEMQKSPLLALEKGIFFYYFCLDQIDWDKKLVLAYYLDPLKKDWNQKYLPFPQVLYDMATFPLDLDKLLDAKESNRRLRADHDLQVINTARYFDKWLTCEAVSFFKETREYIPETTLLSLTDLEKFLNKFEFIFVKSNYGSYGSQVLRVERQEDHYLCRTGGSRLDEWRFNRITDLYEFLEDQLGTYAILQNGIRLAKINQRIFDMRVLCQKNSVGQWTITAVNYRIAPLGGIVTNYSAGADEVLVVPESVMPYPSLSWGQLTKFTKKVLFALESSFGLMGEIGLDVGLDVYGKLWLIEANSKPDTHGYQELTTEEVCSQVYGYPLDYAKFLIRQISQT
ncbi:hypothetical protein Desde_0982 [Desulfitobacterium dehalogenans ATCC 51507]|uniref:ATP-grasp domain-containing protein n=1 Tax=Desulfitobacterium dehalogenans (strain ATCC 51507 / DSM 9161 / JW/IU-DC1) TaxID=756499 RepID=I4A631_DESDJ|nr:YheC/YheD family protein [Desulfitobacterium dehalogenans]AFL99415.1 hypothetical protein Desde_0982 [Desulfitobacterium dehalogenans ATCC 51507]